MSAAGGNADGGGGDTVLPVANSNARQLTGPDSLNMDYSGLAQKGSVTANKQQLEEWKEDSSHRPADRARQEMVGNIFGCPKCASQGKASPAKVTKWVLNGAGAEAHKKWKQEWKGSSEDKELAEMQFLSDYPLVPHFLCLCQATSKGKPLDVACPCAKCLFCQPAIEKECQDEGFGNLVYFSCPKCNETLQRDPDTLVDDQPHANISKIAYYCANDDCEIRGRIGVECTCPSCCNVSSHKTTTLSEKTAKDGHFGLGTGIAVHGAGGGVHFPMLSQKLELGAQQVALRQAQKQKLAHVFNKNDSGAGSSSSGANAVGDQSHIKAGMEKRLDSLANRNPGAVDSLFKVGQAAMSSSSSSNKAPAVHDLTFDPEIVSDKGVKALKERVGEEVWGAFGGEEAVHALRGGGQRVDSSISSALDASNKLRASLHHVDAVVPRRDKAAEVAPVFRSAIVNKVHVDASSMQSADAQLLAGNAAIARQQQQQQPPLSPQQQQPLSPRPDVAFPLESYATPNGHKAVGIPCGEPETILSGEMTVGATVEGSARPNTGVLIPTCRQVCGLQQDVATQDFTLNCLHPKRSQERSKSWAALKAKVERVSSCVMSDELAGATQDNVRNYIASEPPAGGEQVAGERFFDYIITTFIDSGVQNMDCTP